MLTNTLFKYVSQTSFEQKSAAIQKVLWSPFLLLAWWNCIIFLKGLLSSLDAFWKNGCSHNFCVCVAAITQVWPQFIFLFVQNQWTLIGETLSSFVPPSHSLVSVSNPWRGFLSWHAPFKGICLASCVASGTTEKQGYRQKQVTLFVSLLKTHLHRSLIL